MIELRKARHVLAVMRYGGFAKAAEQINITQSALTKSVQAVEQEMGLVLVRREPHGITLTAEGEWFMQRASHLLAVAGDFESEGQALRGVQTGQLRIGTDESSFDLIVLDLVPRFAEKFPGVRLEIFQGSIEQLSAQVMRGDVEIIVGPMDDMQSERGLSITRLRSATTTPFVRRGHPLDRDELPELKDLFTYPLVGPRPPEAILKLFRAASREGNSTYLQPHVTTPSWSIIRKLVARTDAFSFVFPGRIKLRSFSDSFRVWEDWRPFPSIHVDMAWRSQWRPSLAAEQFISMLRQATRSLD